MTLLQEIIDGASGQEPVPSLLRKLKVLAARTSTGRLGQWVNNELEGYSEPSAIPEYRGPFDSIVLGHFMGTFQSELRNVPIPPSTFPEDMRDSWLFKLRVTQSIAEVQQWATQESINLAWPPDAVRFYNFGIQQGSIQQLVRDDMVLATAARPVTRGVFVGIVDTVRTRILDLALELEQVAPSAGQPDATTETKSQAAQVVNTYNFYDSSNVAINSREFTQIVDVPKLGDRTALLRYLGAAGVEAESLIELREAFDADQADSQQSGKANHWQRTRAWFARAGTDVSTGAVGGAIVAAGTAYLSSH